MLTPQQLQEIPEAVLLEFRELELDIIRDVSRRVGKAGELTATGVNQLDILYDMADAKEAEKLMTRGIKSVLLKAEESIRNASNPNPDIVALLKKREGLVEQNRAFIDNISKVTIDRTKNEILKMSKTTGFMVQREFIQTGDILNSVLNRITIQVGSGAFSYQQLAEKYIRILGDSGIRTIDYESGKSYAFDMQLKRLIVDSTRNMANTVSLKNAQDLGTDLMEISAHAGARPDHAEWQGKVLSLDGRRGYLSLSDIGHGDVTGFGGANCRHTYFPYLDGMTRNYTEEELDEFKNELIEVDGQKISRYDATQEMRRYERTIRASKRRLQGFEGLGDTNAYQKEMARLRRLRGGYKGYSEKTGLRVEPYSVRIYKPR